MIIAIKLFLFVVTFASFGYVASALFLNERRISVLIPFSIIVGLAGYMFFVNLVSYAIPIKITTWLILVLFILFSITFVYKKGIKYFAPTFDFTKKQLKILFGIALVISVVSAVVQLRAFDPDDRSHLIAASTSSEGNFPIMSPMDPDARLPYHYGPDLLAGATHKVTGVPLLQNYDIQTFFFGGATFLLAFILAFAISGSFFVSIVAAIFFYFGGGSLFLNIGEAFSPLYHKYVLGENVVGAWKFIADMVMPQLNHFYTYGIRSHTTVMGTPIMLAVVYLCFQFIRAKRDHIKNGVITGLFLGSIALSLDTNFVVVSFVLGLVLLWKIYLFISGKDSELKQQYLGVMKYLFTLLFVASILAIFQGGLITNVFLEGRIINKGQTFALNEHPLMIPTLGYWEPGVEQTYAPVFSATFAREFGLMLVLFAIALYYFRKDKKILLISAIGLTAFLVPFTVVYVLTPGAMLRLFSVSTPIFSFVIAFLICDLYEKHKDNIKIKILLIIVSLMTIYSGVAFQLACMVTPWSNFGNIHAPFVSNPPQPTAIDSRMYQWIKDNTVQSSRFFPYSPMFIIETGRMAPGSYPSISPDADIPIYNKIVDHCDEGSIKEFAINYFVISSNNYTREDFLKKCVKSNYEQIYVDTDGSDYREIYKRK